jgi:hypothetical protein
MRLKASLGKGWLRVIAVQGALVLVLLLASLWEAGVRNRAFLAFTGYLVSPSASPEDARVVLASELFESLARRDRGRYQTYNLRVRGIKNYLDRQANRRYYVGRMHLQKAREAERRGNWDEAVVHYENAITGGTEQIRLEAHLFLGDLLRSRGDDAGFHTAMQVASAFVPGVPVDFAGCSQMKLLGGYVDERDLELDAPIHIVLIWESDGAGNPVDLVGVGAGSEEEERWRFLAWRARVFQVGLVENLVPDGGFERMMLPGTVILPQLPNRLYRAQELIHTVLAYESPLQNQNMILTLYGRGQMSVGLGSPRVDVPTGQGDVGYLVTGWYQSTEGAVPRIGVRWWLRDAVSWDDNVSTYAVEQPSTDWVGFARLAIPPENTDRVQAWIINADEFSHLSVDNLGLFRVPLPCSVE